MIAAAAAAKRGGGAAPTATPDVEREPDGAIVA